MEGIVLKCPKCGKSGLTLKLETSGFCADCELAMLRTRLGALEAQLSPEQNNAINLRNQIQFMAQKVEQLRQQEMALTRSIHAKDIQLVQMDDEILYQSFGLYHPVYDFANSDVYKQKLAEIRDCQKYAIKNGTAVAGNMNWVVNNSVAQGRQMVTSMQKLLIRAFNSECDEVISRVKFNNIDASIKRITASRDAISKLGQMMNIYITSTYYNLKISELHLAYEYQIEKQKEKEEQRRIREELREQKKLQQELEEARTNITKEQRHFEKAHAALLEQIAKEPSQEIQDYLLIKLKDIEDRLTKLDASLKEVDYREANQKAGYVYVISNIGAFGNDVYKIGMTRRLEPMDRIDELGDASVPFAFDVHALIFSDNAPALEAALHNAFSDRKVNMVNQRREFFRVTLDEIEAVVKANYDKAVEFVKVAPAEQYRESSRIRELSLNKPRAGKPEQR